MKKSKAHKPTLKFFSGLPLMPWLIGEDAPFDPPDEFGLNWEDFWKGMGDNI
jgi:hypothetical protein